MSKPTYKFIIKSNDKIHSFKTLKMAREFARYIGGLVIIARVRVEPKTLNPQYCGLTPQGFKQSGLYAPIFFAPA